jgi:hypothetical protein
MPESLSKTIRAIMKVGNQMHIENIKKALRYYASIKWPVIPLCSHDHSHMSEGHKRNCSNPGKMPLIKEWPSAKVPTQEQIEDWCKKWPTMNIGLVLGQASRVVAIDVDGEEEGDELLEELSSGDLPETLQFKTPGGGMRYLYYNPHPEKAHKFSRVHSELAHTECALLGDGCQTVLPPSIHQNGGHYEWIEKLKKDKETGELLGLTVSPNWMLRRLRVINSSDNEPGNEEVIFNRLSNGCKVFAEDWQTQKNIGLNEDRWFLWSSLLTYGANMKTAMNFSESSQKHNEQSVQRIEELSKKGKKPIRCATFGCSQEQIQRCFGDKVKTKENGDNANSPVSFIQKKALSIAQQMMGGSGNSSLEKVGIFTNDEGNRIERINGNLFAKEILRKNQLLYTRDDSFYDYNGSVWKNLDPNNLSRRLRNFLHSFVPDSWERHLEFNYVQTLKLEAPRYDELNIDRSIINLRNTMLDLNNYTPIQHDPKYLSTVQVPIDYDPNAKCPLFLQTLDQIFDQDQQRIDLLAEILGYCLTSDIEAQKAFIFYNYRSDTVVMWQGKCISRGT